MKDFLNSRQLKKLRALSVGPLFTCIYLKLQLITLNKDSAIEYQDKTALYLDLSEEINESAEDIEAVVVYLISLGLIKDDSKALRILKPNCLNKLINADSVAVFKQEAKIYKLILDGGEVYEVKGDYYKQLKEAYKDIDVDAELNKIVLWCEANPTKRKTKRGVKQFVNNWLSHAKDNAVRFSGTSAAAEVKPKESKGTKPTLKRGYSDKGGKKANYENLNNIKLDV